MGEGGESKRNYWIIIPVIVGIIFIGIGIIVFGIGGFFNVLFSIIGLLKWIILLGLVAFIVYWLFKERVKDPLKEVYKDILQETKISMPDNLDYLYLAGDKNHRQIKVGKIIGLGLRGYYSSNSKTKQTTETIFVVKPEKGEGLFSFIQSIIQPRIIVRCPEDKHDTLHADVFINCRALVKHKGYFYPDTIHLEYDMTDNTIFEESLRWINIDMASKSHPLLSKALGITDKDIKQMHEARHFDEFKSGYQEVKK